MSKRLPPMIRVRPARAGLVVRHPQTKRRIPPEGQRVAESSYWLRRLRDGDVVIVQEQPEAPAAPRGIEPLAPIQTRQPDWQPFNRTRYEDDEQ